MQKYPLAASVQKIGRCELRVGDGVWAYARDQAGAIDEAWQRALIDNPNYFNGVVHLIDELSVDADGLSARLLKTDFKSYLYWRMAGFPECGVLDGFGSALIRSLDGAIVLARQRAGNVNGGLVYLPGGFIDGRDVGPGGAIDIGASIARELAEETGLGARDLRIEPGFYVTQTQAHVSVAVDYRAAVDALELKARIEQHIARDAASELTEVVLIRQTGDLAALAMPAYARQLVAALFDGSAGSL